MPGKLFAVWGSAGLSVVLLLAGLPGCSNEGSEEFKAYNELDRPERDATVEGNNAAPASETETGSPDVAPAANGETGGSSEETVAKTETGSTPHGRDEDPAAAETGGSPDANTADATAELHGDVPAIAEKPLPEEVAAAPRKVKLLIKDHQFSMEGGHLRVSYDDIDLLRVLNMEPVTPDAPDLMPKWLRDLDGKRVRIRGFMYPPFQETGIERFVLARDNQICCFGRNPKVYDLIDITMRSGTTTHYIQNRPFDVTGVFHIEPVADPESLRLYSIDDAQVIER